MNTGYLEYNYAKGMAKINEFFEYVKMC